MFLVFLLFYDFTPDALTSRLFQASFLSGSQWIIFTTVTVWLAFLLYSIVDWTVKLFEGYYIPESIITRLQLKKPFQDQAKIYKRAVATYAYLDKHRADVEVDGEKTALRDAKFLDQYRERALSILQPLELDIPKSIRNIKPTVIGNIFCASEMYPMEKYNMDGITLWPKLYKIIPELFKHELEEKNNQIVFIFNSILLIGLLAVVSFLVGFIGLAIQHIPYPAWASSSYYVKSFTLISPSAYALISLGFAFLGRFLYKVSINVAEDYGLIIRSGFDLYRLDLLKQMNYPIPETRGEELRTWGALSNFFVAGPSFIGENDLENYALRKELAENLRKDKDLDFYSSLICPLAYREPITRKKTIARKRANSRANAMG